MFVICTFISDVNHFHPNNSRTRTMDSSGLAATLGDLRLFGCSVVRTSLLQCRQSPSGRDCLKDIKKILIGLAPVCEDVEPGTHHLITTASALLCGFLRIRQTLGVVFALSNSQEGILYLSFTGVHRCLCTLCFSKGKVTSLV